MSDTDGMVQQEQPKTGIEKPIVKYAGKYETPDALEAGSVAILTKMHDRLGIPVPEDGVLVGKGRMFPDHMKLEEAYKKWDAALNQPKAKPGKEAAKPEGKADDGLQIKAEEPKVDLSDEADFGQFVESKGLNMADLEAQWLKAEKETGKGELLPEQYKALGVPKATVNQVVAAMRVANVQAKSKYVDAAVQIAGGESELQAIVEWAKSGMDKAWLEQFNAKVLKDPSVYPDAIARIRMEYEAKAGTNGSRPLVNGVRNVGTQPIEGKNLKGILAGVQKGDAASLRALEMASLADISKLAE